MLTLDTPNAPPQHTAVLLVQTSQAQQVAATNDRTIGVCQLIGNPDPEETAVNVLSPIDAVQGYFYSLEHRRLESAAQVTILKNPLHGTLVDEGDGAYRYRPTAGYLGNDNATLLVEMGGYKVKVIVVFHVLEGPLLGDTSDLYNELCPKLVRRISLDASPDLGTSDLTAGDPQSPLPPSTSSGQAKPLPAGERGLPVDPTLPYLPLAAVRLYSRHWVNSARQGSG